MASLKPTVEGTLKRIKENDLSAKQLQRTLESHDLLGLVPPKLYNKKSIAVAKYILGNKNADQIKQLLGLVHTGFVNNTCPLGTTPYYDWINGRIQCKRPEAVSAKDLQKLKDYKCPKNNSDPFAIEPYIVTVSTSGADPILGCRRPIVRGLTSCPQDSTLAVTSDGTGYCKSNDKTGEAMVYARGPLTPNVEPFKTFFEQFNKLDLEQALSLNEFLTKNRNVQDLVSNATTYPILSDYVRLFHNDHDILSARLALKLNVENRAPKLFKTNDDYLRFAFGLPMVTPKSGGKRRSKPKPRSKSKSKPRSTSRSKSPGKRKPAKTTSKPAKPGKPTSKPAKPASKKKESIDLSSLTLSDLDSTSNIEL